MNYNLYLLIHKSFKVKINILLFKKAIQKDKKQLICNKYAKYHLSLLLLMLSNYLYLV